MPDIPAQGDCVGMQIWLLMRMWSRERLEATTLTVVTIYGSTCEHAFLVQSAESCVLEECSGGLLVAKLSRYRDRLPAISALASAAVKARSPNRYFAGLWTQNLVNGLKWTCRSAASAPYADVQGYMAPSWSWDACPFPVTFELAQADPVPFEDTLIGYIEAACQPLDTNPFGEVRDGHVVLHGIHCNAWAAVSVSSSLGAEARLVLEDRTLCSVSSTSAGLSFLDGLRVKTTDAVPSANGAVSMSTLQRDPQALRPSECPQTSCAGRVRLLWIDRETCLILAYSLRVQGSFERIGILHGSMCPDVPSLGPAEIRLV